MSQSLVAESAVDGRAPVVPILGLWRRRPETIGKAGSLCYLLMTFCAPSYPCHHRPRLQRAREQRGRAIS